MSPQLCSSRNSQFIISLVLLISLAICGAEDIKRYYSDCSKSFRCGKQNISYPFWGGDQPHYCGLEGLNVWCEEDFLFINMGLQKFRVLDINRSTRAVTMQRMYIDRPPENDCLPLPSVGSGGLNRTNFDYDRRTEDIYLFYNCGPTRLNISLDHYSIPNSSMCGAGWFVNDTFLQVHGGDLKNCKNNVKFPVDREVFEEFSNNVTMEVQDLLKASFVVYYRINNERACFECEASGGVCWSGTNLTPRTCLRKPGLGASITTIMLFCLIYSIIKCGSGTFTPFLRGNRKFNKDVEAFIKQYGSSTPKRYSFSEVKKITNSFNHELGKGGYGNVFKGKLSDGRVVAVKVLNETKGNGEEFINEVASIGRTSHVNVVTLLGFCFEGRRRALIYEFMPNGSLEKFIYKKSSSVNVQNLGLEKLYNIALGIARGLEYLHRGCNTRILHFDIKPHNILLNDDFCPKISDFGLAKLYTREESIVSMLQARGTIGYIAPEVFCRNFGGVSHKSDVYSYGMMILEMVGGRTNVDAEAAHTSEIYFPHWIYKHLEVNEEISFAYAMSIEENEIARKMVIVGLWCIQTNPSERPAISKVIDMLEGSMAALEIPPKPYLCSPPRAAESSS